MDILQILPPELIIYGFIGFLVIFAAFLILYYLNRVRPVTDEAVLGNYEFHMIGTGEEIKGLVTLASRHVNESLLNSIRRAAEQGIIEKGNPSWDKIGPSDWEGMKAAESLQRSSDHTQRDFRSWRLMKPYSWTARLQPHQGEGAD